MKTARFVILIVFISSIFIISCDDDDDVSPQVSNAVFLAGDRTGNYTIENYIIEVLPKDQEGIYYDSEVYGLSLCGSYLPELFFDVGFWGGSGDYYGFCYCQCRSNWEICLLENDTMNIKLLALGDTLKTQKNWHNSNSKDYVFATHTYYENFPNSVSSSGLWNETQNGYLGIRLIENMDTTYGWIRISITGKYKMEIKDFSLEI